MRVFPALGAALPRDWPVFGPCLTIFFLPWFDQCAGPGEPRPPGEDLCADAIIEATIGYSHGQRGFDQFLTIICER